MIESYWFIFCKDELLVKETSDGLALPTASEAQHYTPELASQALVIGELQGVPCHLVTLPVPAATTPSGYRFEKVRETYGSLPEDIFWFSFRAVHLSTWLRNNQCCGRCGSKTKPATNELALVCTSCGHTAYPRISPAIIVAVTHQDKILLAHSARFPAGRYSVLAGFVEPGETLEQCVQREVWEEVGIKVGCIRYFGSQPWPFPDSLMVGFTAQALTTDIKIDNQEILAADWFTADNLPDIPRKLSISRRLIDWFVATQAND